MVLRRVALYELALDQISRCNGGEGLMLELAREALTLGKALALAGLTE